MKRIVIAVAFVVFLMALDAFANDFRFTSTFWGELKEFGRLFNMFVTRNLS